MLALNDHNIMPEKEFVGILQNAADAHENAASLEGGSVMNVQVALLIKRIMGVATRCADCDLEWTGSRHIADFWGLTQ